MTPRMRETMRLIEQSFDERGIAPTFEELMTAMGLSSKSTLFVVLQRLEDRGLIRRVKNRVRGIEIVRRLSPGMTTHCRFSDSEKAAFLRGFLHDYKVLMTDSGLADEPDIVSEFAYLQEIASEYADRAAV